MDRASLVTSLQMSYLYMLVYTMCCVEANIAIITHPPPQLCSALPSSAGLAHFTRSVKSPGSQFLLPEPEIEKESRMRPRGKLSHDCVV